MNWDKRTNKGHNWQEDLFNWLSLNNEYDVYESGAEDVGRTKSKDKYVKYAPDLTRIYKNISKTDYPEAKAGHTIEKDAYEVYLKQQNVIMYIQYNDTVYVSPVEDLILLDEWIFPRQNKNWQHNDKSSGTPFKYIDMDNTPWIDIIPMNKINTDLDMAGVIKPQKSVSAILPEQKILTNVSNEFPTAEENRINRQVYWTEF